MTQTDGVVRVAVVNLEDALARFGRLIENTEIEGERLEDRLALERGLLAVEVVKALTDAESGASP